MKALAVLGTLVVLIAGQDTKTVLLPASGNDSSSAERTAGKAADEPAEADLTRGTVVAALVPPHPQPMLSSDYFFPVPQREFPHHRSEGLPYGYEYAANIGYPLAQSFADVHSSPPAAMPSKQLVVASFIGLLLLLAIIQNTLSAVKRKDAIIDLLSSRQKRDVYAVHDFHSATPLENEILNSDARVRCIQRTICLENRKLSKDLGAPGVLLAKYLTRNVEKSLKSPSGWDRLVRDAGAAGIRGEDCNVLYRDCDVLVTREMHEISRTTKNRREK